MRLLAAIFVLTALSASAQTSKVVYEYGPEEKGNLSGKGGTDQAKVGSRRSDDPNSTDPVVYNVRKAYFAEASDRPCVVWLNEKIGSNGVGVWSECREREGDGETLQLSGEDQRFSGVQVCMNGAKDRIKGVRLFVSEYEGDGVRKTLVRKKAQMREFKRPNCDEKDGWMQEQRCAEGSALTGLVIDYRSGKGVGNTSDVITGLTPICRKITKRTVTVGDK